MALLAKEEGLTQFPLFLDYGQLGREKELSACLANFRIHQLPDPRVASLEGYGRLLSSGITDSAKHIYSDAFLPCRNLFFITVGAAYAFQRGASAVSIGLLNEATSLFPDQTRAFLRLAETVISQSVGMQLTVVAPLMMFSKGDVVRMAKLKGIKNTYSCHAGTEIPCGICVACREYVGVEG